MGEKGRRIISRNLGLDSAAFVPEEERKRKDMN